MQFGQRGKYPSWVTLVQHKLKQAQTKVKAARRSKLQKEQKTFDFVSAAEELSFLSRFELSTCRGESATG
jgi:hypothetical protein